VRLEALSEAAAATFPGLVPARAQLERETGLMQRDKDGTEVDQGLFFSHVLADERAGRHLCHAMLLPRAESHALLPELEKRGALELPQGVVIAALEVGLRSCQQLGGQAAPPRCVDA